jgi:uncharacterized protein with GYD domain
MSLYFLLGTLTENGQRMLLRNPDMMIEAIRECDCEGAQILGQYAVLGKYDYVMIAEADDNEAVARLALEIGVRAGLHTETLPAMAIGVLSEEESGDEGQGEARFADFPSPSSEEWRLPGRGS